MSDDDEDNNVAYANIVIILYIIIIEDNLISNTNIIIRIKIIEVGLPGQQGVDSSCCRIFLFEFMSVDKSQQSTSS